MKKILKMGWVVLVLWLIILVGAIATLPKINDLVRDKANNNFNSTYSSTISKNILLEMDKSNNVKSAKTKKVDMVLIYYNKNTISDQNKLSIKSRVDNLINKRNEYGVLTISSLFANSDLADSYISKDKTTLLVPVSLERGSRTVASIRSSIMNIMKADGVTLSATSSDLINEDFRDETKAGVKQTELITILFIVAVLLLIFRSPITPFANLMTVSIAFLVSLNITFQLVKNINFPVSNFTEMFLVLILFGIGTDYTMLLLMRYKEELHNGKEINTAISNTYKTAGKTILYSSFTIFIGFMCLYFVQFKFYRSTSAIAIGVVVLDLVLFTFVPVIMKILGEKLFWSPFKTSGHSESKVWGKVAGFSTKSPYVAIIFTGLVCCLIFFYNGKLSYNDLKEVDKSYASIVGNDIVTKHFSAGESMPVTIAVKNTVAMNNQSDLAAIDKLTENLKSVKYVKNVYSVTQPKSNRIDAFYLNNQSKTLKHGLESEVSGLNQASNGLDYADSYLNELSKSNFTSSIFYIPLNNINSGNFVKSMNTYMSSDRKITKLTVTLTIDPYSSDAMDVVNQIHNTVESGLEDSNLKNATYGVSGITQTNLDLKHMSNSDFSKARIIMLFGIFIVLLFVSRSFWMPVFVMGSLIASYFIAISLSGIFFNYVLNEPEISWLVPFCSFIMIIALGVDYSIFLIMRHNENSSMLETDSIVLACKKVGGVITSAALILSGTFASMYPSGVTTLMELSITVILGLMMLCFVFLPVSIPTMISLKYKLEVLKSNKNFIRLTEEH